MHLPEGLTSTIFYIIYFAHPKNEFCPYHKSFVLHASHCNEVARALVNTQKKISVPYLQKGKFIPHRNPFPSSEVLSSFKNYLYYSYFLRKIRIMHKSSSNEKHTVTRDRLWNNCKLPAKTYSKFCCET